ncbi:exocyst complex component EXO70H1-like [Corylus avellana]|uniref:exocyst complex component EXO70H1-like n=1 Tax=Corylus avellana TaxID=13451 RepID=UPI001E226D57|nr:exocyst complex component EXO70H1-like [Corylus avellana]
MPRKGMRNIFFKSSSPSPTSSPSRSIPPSSPSRTFSESLMDENFEIAESLITKWDSDTSSYAKITSLFHEDRHEAKQYLNSVRDLQSAMHHLITQSAASDKLVRGQNLLQMAMHRLEKEFYQLLSINRAYLDPESVSVSSSRSSVARSSVSDLEDDESEDEFGVAGNSISEVERVSATAVADLKAIADCMISSGYGKECVKIYKIIRKSIIDEALYNLGHERLSLSQAQKMDWEVMELKIKNWLNAVKVAVKTLFYGERILCDRVFSASASIRESCFDEISKEAAIRLFGFPEIVAKCKKSPEKMFRTLDMYEAISSLWPEIETIFSDESTLAVRSQAVTSLIKLGEAVRTTLTDFETAIQKESSKTASPGGGVHPLTRYVMNYISFLSDYSGVLADIVADWPLTVQAPLPESYFGSPESDDSPITVRMAWLILVLLCKLDGKAEHHKDVALSYLFLANNLQYVVVKVRTSNLKLLLGDDWVPKHEAKVKQYAANYERMGWSKVFASLPEDPTAEISPEQARDCFKKFNAAFDEAYRKQSTWVVSDPKLRDEIKISVAKKLGPAYQDFYEKNRAGLRKLVGSEVFVRFAPDDLGNYLSDLFFGTGVAGSVSSSSSASHSRGRHRG